MHSDATDEARFNWRYKFHAALPTRETKLLVQVWDRRATGPNEALAECVLQLATLHGNVQRLKCKQEVPRQFYTCTHPNHVGPQAKIDMEVAMLPKVEADQFENLVGHGRDAPNQHPHLPAPQRGGGVTALTKGAKNLFKKKGGDEPVLGGDTALGITQADLD